MTKELDIKVVWGIVISKKCFQRNISYVSPSKTCWPWKRSTDRQTNGDTEVRSEQTDGRRSDHCVTAYLNGLKFSLQPKGIGNIIDGHLHVPYDCIGLFVCLFSVRMYLVFATLKAQNIVSFNEHLHKNLRKLFPRFVLLLFWILNIAELYHSEHLRKYSWWFGTLRLTQLSIFCLRAK